MAAKNNNYQLEENDTPFSKYKYGERFYPVVHGNKLVRNFKIIICKHCLNQIPARLTKCFPKDMERFTDPKHQYRLINNDQHNKSVYCNKTCKDAHMKVLREKSKLAKKRYPRVSSGSGYPATKPTKSQNDKMISYLMGL